MTSFNPADPTVKVGPVNTVNGTSYRYSIDGHLSVRLYHNSASARHDSRRPQRLSNDPNHVGQIEPAPPKPLVSR